MLSPFVPLTNSKSLYYIAPDNKLMAVSVNAGTGFEHSAPTRLFDLQVSTTTALGFDYIPDRDGQRFIIRISAKGSKSTAVTVMTNWLALAKK